MRTRGGRAVINARRAKGRSRLTAWRIRSGRRRVSDCDWARSGVWPKPTITARYCANGRLATTALGW